MQEEEAEIEWSALSVGSCLIDFIMHVIDANFRCN